VVEYHVPGFSRQALVTNVLEPRRISRADWTRLTTDCASAGQKLLPGLFHRRWEIEVSPQVAEKLGAHVARPQPPIAKF
jgi:hypothetical protein